jgi:hypothetical protein
MPPPEMEELVWYSLELSQKLYGLTGQGLRRMRYQLAIRNNVGLKFPYSEAQRRLSLFFGSRELLEKFHFRRAGFKIYVSEFWTLRTDMFILFNAGILVSLFLYSRYKWESYLALYHYFLQKHSHKLPVCSTTPV